MTKIVNLKIETIMKVRTVEAKPNGRHLVIGGENGQGKSSTQRALKMMLGGKAFAPAEPVNYDARKGTGQLLLDNGYQIDFTITKDRKPTWKITNRANPAFFSDSITLIKELVGDISFDPGDFMKLGDKEKVETILRIAGIDFTDLDQRRAKLYDERTATGRDVKRLQGQLSGLNWHEVAPKEEEDSAALVESISEAQTAIADYQQTQQDAENKVDRGRDLFRQIQDIDAEIARLQAKRKQTEIERDETLDQAKELSAKAEAFVLPDLKGLQERLKDIEETNRMVRENAQFHAVKDELEKSEAAYEKHTEDIQDIDDEKRKLLKEAALPIEGLTFEEDGLRFQGSLWAACSESEQWKVATAMACAQNPQGIVFISQSGGMSKKTRAAVCEQASEQGCQLMMEVVEDAEDVLIVIDNGEVVENRIESAGTVDSAS